MLKYRLIKLSLLLFTNGLIIALLLYGFEQYLYYTDPFLQLPFDSFYYKNNQFFYPDLIPPPDANRLSWGQVITTNEFKLRERPFNQPKAADICRIMVLGDSFTYGAGLSWEQRFTYLVETQLNQAFPQQKFEVFNIGRSGAPTTSEVKEAQNLKDLLTPDLIVIGFVFNDPQPKNQDYRLEKELFDTKYGTTVQQWITTIAHIGLPQTAQTTQDAINNLLISAEIIPSWEVGLQRTYQPDSAEWQNFEQALRDLKQLSDDLQLPLPIFMVLNQGVYVNQPTDYNVQAPAWPIYLRWLHQAEQTAAQIGFRHYNHEAELLQLSPAAIPLNVLDQHPSAQANQLYAQKLFTTLAADFKVGHLCPQPNGARSISPTPLSPKRLLSIKFGSSLRFWGYVINQTEPLQLNFGWQALDKITVSYQIKLELIDAQGKTWVEQESVPCQGKCPTPLWPSGFIAPPGAEIIYWPEKGTITPLPLTQISPQKAFRDVHQLTFPPTMPTGSYTLTLSILDHTTPITAYDELGQTELPQVILGTLRQD